MGEASERPASERPASEGGPAPSITPYRIVPFDAGAEVDAEVLTLADRLLYAEGWRKADMPPLLHVLSRDLLAYYELDEAVHLYLYRYGIGVFVVADEPVPVASSHFAIGYCDRRRRAHDLILAERHPRSPALARAVRAARAAVRGRWGRSVPRRWNPHYRATSSSSWDPAGVGEASSSLPYVMTICWCDIPSFAAIAPGSEGYVDLQIILQPSLAQKEDSAFLRLDHGFAPDEIYQRARIAELPMPRNYSSLSDISLYMSWAAVLAVPLSGVRREQVVQLLCAMEANLQSMWTYAYCLAEDLRRAPLGRLPLTYLASTRNRYRLDSVEFRTMGDASAPSYVMEILGGMIETSGLDAQEQQLENLIDATRDIVEARNARSQQTSDRVSELLLFLLALIQLPSLLDGFVSGDFGEMVPAYLAIMGVLAVIFVVATHRRE